MIFNINGEQPFQVNSSSFSVSPSESGYDLYISANGIEYSKFATVAAGQNKQFVDMANGQYYILSGNTDEVQVNWNRECGGGGSGSGGSGSTVSWNQELTAGTEIAQITINGNSQAVYAPAGGSADLGPLSASVIELSAATETIDGKFVNYATTAVTSGIAADLETLSAYTETIQPYTLPIASANDLGGIKVGSGLSIDANGVLSANGGGGEQDFIVVDALSAVTNPVSGMVVYLKAHSWVSETEAYKVQRTTEGEGEMSHIKSQYDYQMLRAYLDGNGYIQSYSGEFTWVNDGLWHSLTAQQYDGQEWIYATVRYKIVNDTQTINNTYILFDKAVLTEQSFTVDPEAGQATSTEVTDETDRYDVGKFYQYNGGNWELVSMPKVYYIDTMSDADKTALYNEMSYAAGSGETDFSGYKVYKQFTIEGRDINVPSYFSCSRENDGHIELLFFGNYAAYNNSDATYIINFGLKYDGSVQLYSNNAISNHHQGRLSVLRDREWLKYDNGTYSGYTFDLSNVEPSAWAINWQQDGWGWLLQIIKDGDGNGYRDGDWNSIPDDNQYHFVDRNSHYYYRKLTGDTLTVLFTLNGPSSISDLNLDANVTYTAATETLDVFSTNNGGDTVFYTGNTCSGEWSFEIANTRNFCLGTDQSQNNTPVCAFKCASGTTAERSFSNPIISYEKIEKITLYDSNNNPYDFEHKFYFDYGLYTVSLIANESEYRYAQLTVVHN